MRLRTRCALATLVEVKRLCVLILLAAALSAAAQENTVTLDDLVRSAQQWAKENLDEDALRVLQSADQDRVKQLLADLQREFHGEYVLDLASLRDAVKAVLPLLEQYEETLPYAIWLKTRLDYLEAANELRVIIPPPKTEPGKPPLPRPNPTPQMQREIWVKKLATRPWPQGAKAYVPRLKPIFAAQKIPPELIWIAEVESSFDPRARSPDGATGLFQLMPATAKRFGLKTWPLDQRLDADASAIAAAKYLATLHRHFNDWRLTLAAYNAGEGTVDKLLQRAKVHSFDAIAKHLPAETQMYVPKVEAVIQQREGIKL